MENTTATQQQQMSQQPQQYAPPAYPVTAQTAPGQPQMPLQTNNPYYQQQQQQPMWGPQGQWQNAQPPPPQQGYGYYGYPQQGMGYAPQAQSMGGPDGAYPGQQRGMTQEEGCCVGFLGALAVCCCLEAVF